MKAKLVGCLQQCIGQRGKIDVVSCSEALLRRCAVNCSQKANVLNTNEWLGDGRRVPLLSAFMLYVDCNSRMWVVQIPEKQGIWHERGRQATDRAETDICESHARQERPGSLPAPFRGP